MKARWDYYSQYMEKKQHVPNHQPVYVPQVIAGYTTLVLLLLELGHKLSGTRTPCPIPEKIGAKANCLQTGVRPQYVQFTSTKQPNFLASPDRPLPRIVRGIG